MTQLFRDFAAQYGDSKNYLVGLVTVTNEESGVLAETLRLNSTDRVIESRGDKFYGVQLDFQVPPKQQEGQERITLVLPTVSTQLLAALRAVTSRYLFLLEIVLYRTPDVVELGPYRLREYSKTFNSNEQTLQIEATYRDLWAHPRPRRRFTPKVAPGLFGKVTAE